MRNKGVKRIIALVVILFFIPGLYSFSQCKNDFLIEKSFITQGINNGIDHYYQNLIVKDVGLASQMAFDDISLRFDYSIHCLVDRCNPGQLEIKVFSPTIHGSPLYYLGYDISSSIRPEKADLVFHIVMPDGFITDSLVFYNVPVEKDGGLYSSLSYTGIDTSSAITANFARAVFYYTKSSYEKFRDHLLQIDQYFAAKLLADSTLSWASGGFLSESVSRPDLIMRQIELERIIRYLDPRQFNLVLATGTDDMAGLAGSYRELLRLNSRYKAIISFNHKNSQGEIPYISDQDRVNQYLGWLDFYYQLAYRSDFRYVNFIEGLATPQFSNSSLAGTFRSLHNDYGVPVYKSQFLQMLFVNGFIDRGRSFEMEGNQLRALNYYKTASHLSYLLHLNQLKNIALQDEIRMKDSIAFSYLAISRKSVQTGNPVLAAQYFNKARDLFQLDGITKTMPDWLTLFDEWLYLNIENQAVKNLELKNYDKALLCLNEIEIHCLSTSSYPCPGLLSEWMGLARQGIYLGLLKKSMLLFSRDEFSEAGQKYRDAVALRMGAGYRIERDIMEADLERNFRQISYDEMVEEGMKLYRNAEYTSALYYFNKADYLQKPGLTKPYPDLLNLRQESARQVILQNLSEGRVRTWAHDFTGAEAMLQTIEKMLFAYQVDSNDSLSLQYFTLKERLRLAECEEVGDEFNVLISNATDAENRKDFIQAHVLASDAVKLSMDNLKCRIMDEEAWLRKFSLETPAEFQLMEKELNARAKGECNDYLEKYQELRNYYQKYRLTEFGIVFIPLFERVTASSDSAFLICMFRHYLRQRDYDHAFSILSSMKELGIDSRSMSEEQKEVAGYLARRDLQKTDGKEPWELLASYSGKDKWYRPFNHGYKQAWLKASKWKMSYWPLIWKK
jgi:pentatricopeptide repeat protein